LARFTIRFQPMERGWAMSKVVARLGLPALAVLVLAGCGSSSKSSTTSGGTGSTSASVTAGGTDQAIAATVPATIKSKGTLNVAMEAQYAPNEFVGSDGHTIIGMDADLIKAIAETMGLKVNLINTTFEGIIPGLAAGRYDLGVSSFTDTKEREKTVDFVTYYKAGISFYAKTGSSVNVKTVADICGKTVAVEKGTTELEEATKQSAKCTKEGKKAVTVLSFPGQNPVTLAVASGRAELAMADSPVVAYQIKVNGNQVQLTGESYGFAPYGIAIPKKSGLQGPILASVKKLMASGTYTKILEKWGIQSGAISESEVKINGAIS
jgi:polar amino acid transport system substrate-binding protein